MLTLTDSRLCEATIDRAALRDNARTLAAFADDRPLLADVSADGHGHGAVEASLAALAGGAQWLRVTSAADALVLRKAGIRAPIVAALETKVARGTGVFLAGDPAVPLLQDPGVALYGLGEEARRLRLASAMRVSAVVLTTKTIERGDGVSYGYTYRAEKTTGLAMVAIGYADGLDRRAGNTSSILLAGKQRRIVGRVAMNAAVVELRDDRVAVGDTAIVLGGDGEASAARWADTLGVTEDEVVTVFGRHLSRRYR